LHVLVDIIETKYPLALDFYAEIPAVEEARRVNLQASRMTFSALRAALQQMEAEMAIDQQSLEFNSKLSAFTTTATLKFNQAEYELREAERAYSDLIRHFGEDSQPCDEFYDMLAKFATHVASAHADNDQRRRSMERQARKMLAQTKRNVEIEKQKKHEDGVKDRNEDKGDTDEGMSEANGIEQVLSKVRTGTFRKSQSSLQQQEENEGSLDDDSFLSVDT